MTLKWNLPGRRHVCRLRLGINQPEGIDDDTDQRENCRDGQLRCRTDVLGPRTSGNRCTWSLAEYPRHTKPPIITELQVIPDISLQKIWSHKPFTSHKAIKFATENGFEERKSIIYEPVRFDGDGGEGNCVR